MAKKIIPKNEHLAVFIRLLTRSATGMPITQYTSHFRAPRKGGEMHVVLVDNGRSVRLGMEKFWPSLKCIRCGACMNTCPVYRRSGGLSYGSTYMGPIGIIMMPTFDLRRYSELPFASTLNGSCSMSRCMEVPLHTLFQVSTSGALVQGVYEKAVSSHLLAVIVNKGRNARCDPRLQSFWAPP
jgi:L-lactate dehydrogenase complex protein LldF